MKYKSLLFLASCLPYDIANRTLLMNNLRSFLSGKVATLQVYRS